MVVRRTDVEAGLESRPGAAVAAFGCMDALELMHRDHEKLKQLLDRAEHAEGESSRDNLFVTIRTEFVPHERMEEEIFYPALRSHRNAQDIVLEGYQEHHLADLLMDELIDTPAATDVWKAKMKVLKESIEHHIEEEEGEMFRKARSIFEGAELEQLGRRMEALKKESEA